MGEVKIELTRRYLERHPSAMSYEGGTVIDVGGTREFHHVLETLFRPADLYVLNVDPESVKAVSSSSLAS
jgi:hypothetical protein